MRYNICLLTFCPIIIVFIIFNVKIFLTFGFGDIITIYRIFTRFEKFPKFWAITFDLVKSRNFRRHLVVGIGAWEP